MLYLTAKKCKIGSKQIFCFAKHQFIVTKIVIRNTAIRVHCFTRSGSYSYRGSHDRHPSYSRFQNYGLDMQITWVVFTFNCIKISILKRKLIQKSLKCAHSSVWHKKKNIYIPNGYLPPPKKCDKIKITT